MMAPTRTSNTASNRVSWIVVIVVSGLVSRTACMDMNSLACVVKDNCNLELDCEGKRIRLLDQKYSYSTSDKQCMLTETSDGACINNNPPMCCVVKEKLCKSRFSREHVYRLYQECSGLESCNVAARSGRLQCPRNTTVSADSNIVKYQCLQGGDTVQFCKPNQIEEKKVVNIYFNDDVEMQFENQICTCTIQASRAYSVTMEDIRTLRPAGTPHCSSAIVDNFDKKCNDSNKVWENFVFKEKWTPTTNVITVKHIFAQGKDDRPTMIWIRVESKQNVQVKCEDAVQGETTPTVGSPSTTKPSSGRATYTATKPSSGSATYTTTKHSSGSATSTTTKSSIGSASSTTTKPSSGSATSTTTPSISTNKGTSVGGTISSSSASPNHAFFTADENKVPVAGIVVPLLLVLLGSAAAVTSVWFWRKRRKAATEKNTNISNVTYVSSSVSSDVTSGKISGTDGTYDLPEEDEYSTIDGTGLPKSSCESDNDGYAVPADAVRADDTTEYDVANLRSKHVLLDPSYARLQVTSRNKVLSTQADDYSHIPLTTRSQLNLDRPNDGSYSHLQGPPTANRNVESLTPKTTDYSHINDSDATGSMPTGWMAANGADDYSHLQVTKPPNRSLGKRPDDEEDTYDHTCSGGAIYHAEKIPVSVVTGLSPLLSHTAASSSGKQEVPVDDDGGEAHAYFTLEQVDEH